MMHVIKNIMRLLRNAVLVVAGTLAALRLRRSARPSAADAPSAEEGNAAGRSRWKRRLKHAAATLAVLAIGGFLFAASGLYPIGASSGHLAVTRWFLNFASSRAVATHAIGIEAPSLDSLSSPILVLKGAGHFETGCRPCHGSPVLRNPRIAHQMTPEPPYLPEAVPEWEPDELFYIVENGLKFAGMPAWPTQQREDEVWAMVAFLLTLPDLSAEEYQRLVTGEASLTGGTAPMHGLLEPEGVPGAVIESCARCHGTDGLGRGAGAFPKLAGQSPTYLYASLQAFARGERHSGIMEPIAAGLTGEEMRALARYYGSLEPPSPSLSPDETAQAIERGEAIARQGIPRQGIPSCIDCHGPAPRNPFYPMLAGQYADYVVLQLKLFKQENRGGTPYAHLMRPVADRLTPEQMRAVALFYESLAADAERPAP